MHPFSKGELVAFLCLQVLGGHLGMLMILSTIFLSRTIVRHPVFVNFCVTWMLYSLSYSLLLYTGQILNPSPNFALCVTQSAMIYGAPVMSSMSVLVFVLHLHLVIKDDVEKTVSSWKRLRLITMLAAPYAVYLLVFTIALFAGNARPERVHRSSLYCTLDVPSITMLAAGISAAGILIALVIETLSAIAIYRHWRTFRNYKIGISVSTLIRSVIVLLISVVALATCLAFVANTTSAVPNFILACLPLSAFLVFGTQMDFLHAWFFCWRRTGRSEAQSSTDYAPSVSSRTDTLLSTTKETQVV